MVLEAPSVPRHGKCKPVLELVWDAHLGPGALGITGLEPMNPFALSQAVELRAGPFAGW